jgi:chromosome segregation ATPase
MEAINQNLRELSARVERSEEKITSILVWVEIQERILMLIKDALAKLSADLTATQTGIANLQALLQTLNNSPGTFSAADQATVDALIAQADAMAASVATSSTSASAVKAAQ